MKTSLASSLCAALTLAAALAPRAAADELFRQDPINTVGGYSSQDARNPGGLGWFSEVADNFTTTSAWTVSSVEFWGGYVTVVPGNTHGFTIRVYVDNDNAPGNLVYQQDISTFTEEVYYTFPAPQNWNGYHYTVNLPVPLGLSPSTTYWLSVVAILDRGGGSPEPQWGWAQALNNAPPFAQQWFFDPNHVFVTNPNNVNMSFVLNSGTGTVGGVCCRGATCTTAFLSGNACSASLPSGALAGASFVPGSVCNTPANTVSPCCYADYNKVNGISVQDIFDFLQDWFASVPVSRTGSDGSPSTLAVQNIFDFLTAWFSGC